MAGIARAVGILGCLRSATLQSEPHRCHIASSN
jgi:hypothetical protein